MPIQLHCESCQKVLQVADSAAGKKTRCPSCQTLLDVPQASGPIVTPKTVRATAQAANGPKPATSGAPMRVTCEGCKKVLQVPASAAGKAVRCPGCQAVVKVLTSQDASVTPERIVKTQPGNSKRGTPGPTRSATSAPRKAPVPTATSNPASPAENLWDMGDVPSALPATNAWSSPTPLGNSFSGGYSSSGGFGTQTLASPKPANRTPFYMITGICISLWGLLLIAGGLLRIVFTVIAIMNLPANAVINYGRLSGLVVGMIIGLLLGVVQLAGGISLATRKSLAMSKTTSIVAAIPCFGGLAFPFGIWAAVLVFSKSARADFRK